MSVLKVYKKSDPGPNGALEVTGEIDPDDNGIMRAHMFARVDNPDPIPVSGTFVSSDVATAVTIHNPVAVLANTEYSQALTADTKWILVRARQNSRLQISFVSGQSGSNFITIPVGSSFTLDKMNLASSIIYFQANVAATDVEIIEGS